MVRQISTASKPRDDRKNAQYAEMVCHCERVSRGELIDAMNGQSLRQSWMLCAEEPVPRRDVVRDSIATRHYKNSGVRNLGARSAPDSKLSDSELRCIDRRRRTCGLSAAIELKKQGIKNILVVDRESEAGGMPRFCDHIGFGIVDLWRLYTGPRYARYYRELGKNMMWKFAHPQPSRAGRIPN